MGGATVLCLRKPTNMSSIARVSGLALGRSAMWASTARSTCGGAGSLEFEGVLTFIETALRARRTR